MIAVATQGGIRGTVGTGDGQIVFVGGVTVLGTLELAGGQGHVLDVLGRDLSTLEGLRQQATVVGDHDRQLRHQGAVAELGFGDLHLGSSADIGELVNGAVIGITREHGAVLHAATAGAVGLATAVQTQTQHADCINTETDGALGEAGLIVKQEPLTPIHHAGRIGSTVAVVCVDVEVAQAEGCFAVLDEAGSVGSGNDGQVQTGRGDRDHQWLLDHVCSRGESLLCGHQRCQRLLVVCPTGRAEGKARGLLFQFGELSRAWSTFKLRPPAQGPCHRLPRCES